VRGRHSSNSMTLSATTSARSREWVAKTTPTSARFSWFRRADSHA
jgi:hypothetical protein